MVHVLDEWAKVALATSGTSEARMSGGFGPAYWPIPTTVTRNRLPSLTNIPSAGRSQAHTQPRWSHYAIMVSWGAAYLETRLAQPVRVTRSHNSACTCQRIEGMLVALRVVLRQPHQIPNRAVVRVIVARGREHDTLLDLGWNNLRP